MTARGRTYFPLTPIFDVEKRHGAIVVGNTPSVCTPAGLAMQGFVVDFTTLDGAWDVTAAGDYAYVAAQIYDGLTVVDISDPTSPTIVGSVTSAQLNGAYRVDMVGLDHVAVACTESDRLTIVNVSVPSAPSIVGSVQDATNLDFPYGLAVRGNYAYVTSLIKRRLTVVDISTLSAPSVVGSIADTVLLEGAAAVAALGADQVLVTCETFGTNNRLVAIDTSNPAAPTIVGSLVDPSFENLFDVAVIGNYAVVASHEGDYLLITVDVTNTAAMSIVGQLADSRTPTSTGARGIAIYSHPTGTYAVSTNQYSDYVSLINLNNMASPSLIDEVTDPQIDGVRIHVHGDLVLVPSNGAVSLVVLKIVC